MSTIEERARAAREAAATLASLSTDRKNALLEALARRLDESRSGVLKANEADLTRAENAGLSEAKRRRLVLDDVGIDRIVAGLRELVELPDPIGSVRSKLRRPNGLLVKRVRCPIGVIAMIYEARPGVTVDAFALCFKAGNAVILKGGKEADESNAVLAEIVREALRESDLPQDALVQMTATDREDIRSMLQLDQSIDLVIPRGGESLIRFVREESRIPTVQHDKGVCHLYVHEAADLDKALALSINGKTSAPATCNALECVLVDQAIAEAFAPRLLEACREAGVELRADESLRNRIPDAIAATAEDFGEEFLDLILATKEVGGMDEAIAHIQEFGSRHTDAIATADEGVATEFARRVQSSCVLVNASTRFNDGHELGLGAEIGISTQRVHAFGPMGLEELTVSRFVVEGEGQIRG